jgi:S1/P1 Nuclease
MGIFSFHIFLIFKQLTNKQNHTTMKTLLLSFVASIMLTAKKSKYVYLQLFILSSTLLLCSWGYKGHRTVGAIAQNHLTGNAAYVVSSYLGGESMADASTWADENKTLKTAPWHYLNLPIGLTHEQFIQAVKKGKNNVYTAIIDAEQTLKDKSSTTEQRVEALKYLIHFVGDAHQPMHVSRKEDAGGNDIELSFDNKKTNLHSLWDTNLIDHEGLSEDEMGQQYDIATPEEIKQWQAAEPVEWLWESYQISSELYNVTKPGQKVDNAYYDKYIKVIRKRINQAGIRLAGELNKLLNNEKPVQLSLEKSTQAVNSAVSITNDIVDNDITDLKHIADKMGQEVTVTGKVYGMKDVGSMILVNLGAPFPNQLLTVVLKGEAKQLQNEIADKTITVTGKVIEYKGKSEIVIEDFSRIIIK